MSFSTLVYLTSLFISTFLSISDCFDLRLLICLFVILCGLVHFHLSTQIDIFPFGLPFLWLSFDFLDFAHVHHFGSPTFIMTGISLHSQRPRLVSLGSHSLYINNQHLYKKSVDSLMRPDTRVDHRTFFLISPSSNNPRSTR